MKSLVIVVELRKPQTKEEEKLYGMCVTDEKLVSRIFIHAKRDRRTRVDTFFHEMVHAYAHWTGKPEGAKVEKAAKLAGQAVNTVFKEVFR